MPFEKQVKALMEIVREALRKRAEADAMSSLPTSSSTSHGQLRALTAQLQMTETRLKSVLEEGAILDPAELKRVMDTVPIEFSIHQAADIFNCHADVVTGSLPTRQWNEQCKVGGRRVVNALHVALLIKGPMILEMLMKKHADGSGSNETLASWDTSCWDQGKLKVSKSNSEELELRLVSYLGESAAHNSDDSSESHVSQEAEMVKEAALVMWTNSVYHLIDAMNRSMEAQGRTIADLANELEVAPAEVEAVYVSAGNRAN